MASFLIPSFAALALPVQPTTAIASFNCRQWPASRFAGVGGTRRRAAVVTRAGPPSTGSYVFAFVFPMSLLIGTILTAMRIGDKLDKEYLEELAINQSIMEAEEDDDDTDEDVDDEDDIDIVLEKELQQPVLQATRTRNRPKREA